VRQIYADGAAYGVETTLPLVTIHLHQAVSTTEVQAEE